MIDENALDVIGSEDLFEQDRVLDEIVHRRSELLDGVSLGRHRPELGIEEPGAHLPRLIGHLRQSVTDHQSQTTDVFDRAGESSVGLGDFDEQFVLSGSDRLSRCGLIGDDTHRRQRDRRLRRERRGHRADHLGVRRHRRLRQLSQRRQVALFVAGERENAVHRQSELLSIGR